MLNIIHILFTLVFSCKSFAAETHGVLQVVKGDVKVKSAKDGQTIRAKVGSKVYPKDAIVTGKDSRAKVVMVDNNVLNISPETQIVIQNYVYAPDQGKKDVLLNVIYGKIRSKVEQKYDGKTTKFQVKTPTAVAGVRGTDFLASFSVSDRMSQVVTFHGEVAVGQPGPGGTILNSVSVTPGQFTQTNGMSPPQSPRPMPPQQLANLDRESQAEINSPAKSDSNKSEGLRQKEKDNNSKEEGNKSDSNEGEKSKNGDKASTKEGENKNQEDTKKSNGNHAEKNEDGKSAGRDTEKRDEGKGRDGRNENTSDGSKNSANTRGGAGGGGGVMSGGGLGRGERGSSDESTTRTGRNSSETSARETGSNREPGSVGSMPGGLPRQGINNPTIPSSTTTPVLSPGSMIRPEDFAGVPTNVVMPNLTQPQMPPMQILPPTTANPMPVCDFCNQIIQDGKSSVMIRVNNQ
ncbi:MAG: FecR domain-containing protein [Bdellovibrionales bacterium]|nr:FecR domain-containing protein [Bdellovibrionales bacterium]